MTALKDLYPAISSKHITPPIKFWNKIKVKSHKGKENENDGGVITQFFKLLEWKNGMRIRRKQIFNLNNHSIKFLIN